MKSSDGILIPGERLAAAAQLAAASFFEGDNLPHRAIDVGCDHAKLAVYLVQTGVCSHVYATDIAKGPVEKAKHNISVRTKKGESLENYISVIQTPGLCNMENLKNISRIFICGMGGETIEKILSDKSADFLRNAVQKTVLILQPQSNSTSLREFLYKNGFSIVGEDIVEDGRFVYPIICALYDGIIRSKQPIDLAMGEINLKNRTAGFKKLFGLVKKSTYERLCAKKQNNLEYSFDETLYNQLCDYEKNNIF